MYIILFSIVVLHDQLYKSNKNVQSVTTLEYVFDIKNWIAPCLDEIHYETKPHVFLFKNCNGKAEMFYNQRSHNLWKQSDSNVCKILMVHK